jgi:hypothetical protein
MSQKEKPASIFTPADLSCEILIDYEQMIWVKLPVQRRNMMVIPWFVNIGSLA